MNCLPTAETPELPKKHLIEHDTFLARAILLGQRLELGGFSSAERLSSQPLMIAVDGGGIGALFRYGVVVLFDVSNVAEAEFLQRLGGSGQNVAKMVRN